MGIKIVYIKINHKMFLKFLAFSIVIIFIITTFFPIITFVEVINSFPKLGDN